MERGAECGGDKLGGVTRGTITRELKIIFTAKESRASQSQRTW